MKKHHKIAISSFGIITIIFMIITGVILNGIIVKQKIEKQNIETKIKELENKINLKTNELAIDLINTKTSLNNNIISFTENLSNINKNIGELKAKNQNDFSQIIENSINSIVIIRTLEKQASGFSINENGFIITNSHNLKNKYNEISSIIQIITTDEKIHSAELIGYSEELDIALLKSDKKIKPLELADSEKIKKGESVIAIGTPEGFSFSVTNGIISATNRLGPNNLPIYLQTNAELNQGNSGGPLINKNGKVVGINNFKIKNSEGIGFALESNHAKEIVNKIYQKKYNQTLL